MSTDTMEKEVNFYQAKKGIMSWIYTMDHKRIGVMYLVASCLALFAGGVFALMIRAQLATPNGMLPMTLPRDREGRGNRLTGGNAMV